MVWWEEVLFPPVLAKEREGDHSRLFFLADDSSFIKE